jgi:hypothetical protein
VKTALNLAPVNAPIGIQLSKEQEILMANEGTHIRDAYVVAHFVLGHLGPGDPPQFLTIVTAQTDNLVAVHEHHAAVR